MNGFPLATRGFGNQTLPGRVRQETWLGLHPLDHREPCFWSGFWWLLIRDNPWMRWVNSGSFGGLLGYSIWRVHCLFRCLKHSVFDVSSLGQNALCDDMLHLQRNSSLQEPIHQFWIQRFILKSGFKKKISIGLIFQKKQNTSSLPLKLPCANTGIIRHLSEGSGMNQESAEDRQTWVSQEQLRV